MQTCENCGVSFEEPENLVEVTSLRVLCPKCTAERAAAKARKAGVATAPLTARPAAASPAMPNPATAKPAAANSAKPAAAAPRAAPAAPPIPARKLEASPRPRPAPAPESSPAPAPKKTARPATAAPASAKNNAAAERAAKKVQVDAEELRRGLKKKGSRELIVAFAVSFVVFGVAGFVLWKVLGTKKAEQAAAQAYQDKVAALKTSLAGFDITNEAGSNALIAFAEEQRPFWTTLEDYSAEVVSREAKAKSFLEGLNQRRDLEQRLTDIEQGLEKAAELAPVELAELRRRLDELASKAEIGGPEFVTRVAADRARADKVYEERLVSAAEAAASAPTVDRAVLTTIQQSEDELFNLLNGTAKAWQKNPQDEALTTKKNGYQDKYQAAIKLADDAVQRFFTPEAIEATPWRDLLSTEQASLWKSAAAKGYERRIENGVLHLIGPDPSEKTEVVMTIGDKEVWRDFEIDMEFTIVKGQFTAYFRVPLVWQDNIWYADLKTDEGFLEPGRTYSYTFRILGSTFTEEQHSEESPGPTIDSVSWTKPRKGAFGIGVAKDTEVKFTRLRTRVLR